MKYNPETTEELCVSHGRYGAQTGANDRWFSKKLISVRLEVAGLKFSLKGFKISRMAVYTYDLRLGCNSYKYTGLGTEEKPLASQWKNLGSMGYFWVRWSGKGHGLRMGRNSATTLILHVWATREKHEEPVGVDWFSVVWRFLKGFDIH
jgi:hypothetical protein